MNLFLRETKKIFKNSLICVIGNESCDLDSAVCAISLAYFYSKTKLKNQLDGSDRLILPVMNIHRDNLPLKTEVTYFLQKNNIDVENLICRNEIPTSILNTSKCILVDHHIPSKNIKIENIIEIFDHRPVDSSIQFPTDCKLNIKEIGSCASLIAELILAEPNPEQYSDILQFLRGPIVVDTINFSEAADKARPLDIEVNNKIEDLLTIGANERNELYQNLIHARSDVSSLNALQLLWKDLKVIKNQDESVTVAIPGYPILVEDYMQKENAVESLQQFGNAHNCELIVLMGMKEIENNSIRRDLGLISLKENPLAAKILNNLLNSKEPDLQLKPKEISNTLAYARFFEQINIRASRKQILPIAQKTIDFLSK